MKVCQFITNPYSRDTRIIKQCKSLISLGFSVDVVCYWNKGFPVGGSTENGVRVIRVRKSRSESIQTLKLVLISIAKRFFTRDSFLVKCYFWAKYRGVRPKVSGRGILFKQFSIEDAVATQIEFNRGKVLALWLGIVLTPVLALLILVLSPLIIFYILVLRIGKLIVSKVKNKSPKKPKKTKNPKSLKKYIKLFIPSLPASIKREIQPFRFLMVMFLTRSFFQTMSHAWVSDADVYQANDPDTIFVAWLAAKLRGAKFVYDSHELYDESFPTRKPFFVRYFIRQLEGCLARRADAVITVNDSIADILQKRYALANRPVVVQNAQELEGEIKISPMLREACFDSKGDKTIFVYAGRITEGRGLDQTVEAMVNADTNAVLIIMGYGPQNVVDRLEMRITQLSLANRAFVLPAVPTEDLRDVLAAADVGLMLTENATLSSYYGLGNKLFHYINSGIPVLVPNQPEKRAVVESYDVGWWIESLEPQDIADKMNEIIKTTKQLKQKKMNCLDVSQQLSWVNQENKYKSIFVDFYEQELYRNNVY